MEDGHRVSEVDVLVILLESEAFFLGSCMTILTRLTFRDILAQLTSTVTPRNGKLLMILPRLSQDTAVAKSHIHAGLRWGYRTHSKELYHPYTVRRGGGPTGGR
jgi:hypothetical protein